MRFRNERFVENGIHGSRNRIRLGENSEDPESHICVRYGSSSQPIVLLLLLEDSWICETQMNHWVRDISLGLAKTPKIRATDSAAYGPSGKQPFGTRTSFQSLSGLPDLFGALSLVAHDRAAAEKGSGREESDSERTPRSYVPPTALSIADFEPSANLF
jgi:hypothetical protein